jgi:hypothetical protein
MSSKTSQQLPAIHNGATQTTQPVTYQTALSNLNEKFHRVKQKHFHQRNQIDLTLETTPRDSRYSNGLLDLMKKEEVMLRDPQSPATKTIVQKVDDSLKAETKSFFAKLTHSNTRKWETLQEKLRKDRDALKQEFLRELQGVDPTVKAFPEATFQTMNNNNNSLPQKKSSGSAPVYTMEDIEREEMRLEADYYKHWYSYETTHLQEAFRLQTMKIDNDWNVHERNIRSEFEAKRAQYLPRGMAETNNHNNNNTTTEADPRFHSAEKQKTLIHTAPVFQPTTHQLSRPLSSSGNGTSRKSGNNSMANVLEVIRELSLIMINIVIFLSFHFFV